MAEEIKLSISVGMIQTEMVVKRALGITRKRDNTGSSVGSLVRRSPKEVKNLVQGHGVPYYTDVRVFVIPPKGESGVGNVANYPLGGIPDTKLYLKFDPRNKDAPKGCDSFAKDDI